MLIITGHLEFRAEEREETLAALAEVTRLSRGDEGCVAYWWAEDLEHPNRFRFFECWETEAHFEAHRAQPFETEFMERHVSRIVGADAAQYRAEPEALAP